MYLNRLSLINFKNIAETQLDFSPRINCFVGDNGTGKTNLLDAVYYLSMCKSAFNLTDGQCTRHGSDAFMVNGVYRSPGDRNENVVCSCKRGYPKKLCRNAKEYEKLSDHIGLIPLVLVSPADISLIHESGEERRRYLNSFISQYDRDYLSALVRYNQALGERNKLLKQQHTGGFDDILEVLDLQLAALGTALFRKRKQLASELSPVVAAYYRDLSGDREQVELSYRSELEEFPFEELLRQSRSRDLANQFTTAGVHRDDLRMTIGGYPLRKYGSQGQQKSFLVALRLAQYDLLAIRHDIRPILLLDDVFDKLDMERVQQLITLVGDSRFGQIFITDCNKVRLESVLAQSGCDYTLFRVGDGEITCLRTGERPEDASARDLANPTNFADLTGVSNHPGEDSVNPIDAAV